MHMISKKDLSDAVMDTLTKSCSPTGSRDRQWRSADAWRGNGACQRVGYILDYGTSSKTRQQYCRWESFAMKTDTLMNGSMVKNHISFLHGIGYFATRRTSFLSWFRACQVRPPVLILQLQGHFQYRRGIVLHLLQVRLLHRRQHQVILRLEKERIELQVIPLQCLCQVFNVDDRTEKSVVGP